MKFFLPILSLLVCCGVFPVAAGNLPEPPRWTIPAEPAMFAAKLAAAAIDGHHYVAATTHFNDLPRAFQDGYDADIVEAVDMRERNLEIEYFGVDLDGDGRRELFLYSGECGSGGEGWLIFQQISGKWRKIGYVFGSPGFMMHNGKVGIIIGHQLGARETAAAYYELKNHKIVHLADVNVFRESGDWKRPTKLEIRYLQP
ncbi:MAG: hypothetical protein MJ033_02105 [Victivallaceae bacterium]|nr:hypothetical protein [Victivallaceae bacterium]